MDDDFIKRAFLRGSKLINKPKRRKPSIQQRTSMCNGCGYPITQQHHLYPLHKHGANDLTVPLCANCHELYHLFEFVYRDRSERAISLIRHMFLSLDKQEQESDSEWTGGIIAMHRVAMNYLGCLVLFVAAVISQEEFKSDEHTRTALIKKHYPALSNEVLS